MAEPIFTISGLRGVVGENLFAETVRNMAGCYGRFLGPGRFAIGRDSRQSGAELAVAARAGFFESGCEVIDLGICPTPTVVHYVRSQKVNGGIVITASHNPVDWNGIKFVHPEGRFLLPNEFEALKLVKAGKRTAQLEDAPLGSVIPSLSRNPFLFARGRFFEEKCFSGDGISNHIRSIRESRFFRGVNGKGFRIGVDAVNGAASLAALEALRAFGCEVTPVFCQPDKANDGFPRRPEPNPENLSELCKLVQKEKLDAGFAFDPDGDRFSCVDEKGVPLGEEASLCLACLYILPQAQGDVVVNLSTSRAVEDVCARFGAKVIRTKVGEVFVIEKMLETGAVLGGEGNGGVIVPEINLTRDGLIAAAIVLGMMAKMGKRLSEIRSDLPQYFICKSVVAATEFNSDKLIAELRREGGDFAVDLTEGIRLVGDSWWVHIRKSNTEPIIRIVAEAKGKEAAQALVNRVRIFIK